MTKVVIPKARPTQAHWRSVLPVHPAAELLPRMSEAELRELGEDIKHHGLRNPVTIHIDAEGIERLLDGCNRLDAMEMAGLAIVSDGNGDLNHDVVQTQSVQGNIDPVHYVLSANLYRRHLTNEQKRELIGKLLEQKPNLSDRQIAKMTRSSHPTVADVRVEKERRGKISTSKTRTDSKGREQPAKRQKVTKPAKPDLTPEVDKKETPIDVPALKTEAAKIVQCSFCGIAADQVRVMVAGAEGNICGECVGKVTATLRANGHPNISQGDLDSHLSAAWDWLQDESNWPDLNAGRKASRAKAMTKLRSAWSELVELAHTKPARRGRPAKAERVGAEA
jgi:ClpX C4-type zinc finger/ParB/Sulfiredoxin domain